VVAQPEDHSEIVETAKAAIREAMHYVLAGSPERAEVGREPSPEPESPSGPTQDEQGVVFLHSDELAVATIRVADAKYEVVFPKIALDSTPTGSGGLYSAIDNPIGYFFTRKIGRSAWRLCGHEANAAREWREKGYECIDGLWDESRLQELGATLPQLLQAVFSRIYHYLDSPGMKKLTIMLQTWDRRDAVAQCVAGELPEKVDRNRDVKDVGRVKALLASAEISPAEETSPLYALLKSAERFPPDGSRLTLVYRDSDPRSAVFRDGTIVDEEPKKGSDLCLSRTYAVGLAGFPIEERLPDGYVGFASARHADWQGRALSVVHSQVLLAGRCRRLQRRRDALEKDLRDIRLRTDRAKKVALRLERTIDRAKCVLGAV
jgi:hypothetical protein